MDLLEKDFYEPIIFSALRDSIFSSTPHHDLGLKGLSRFGLAWFGYSFFLKKNLSTFNQLFN